MHHFPASVAFVLATFAAAASALAQAQLRPEVVVAGAQITLGDIFEGAGAAADIYVAAAPTPGQRLVLRSADFATLAAKYGLDWHNRGNPESIVVVRASRAVPKAVILEKLRNALDEEGIEGPFQVEIRSQKLLLVPHDALPTVAVETLDFDRRSRRFTATLAAPAGATAATRVKVSGRAVGITEVPVLHRRVVVGAVIGEDDIGWRTVRTDTVNRNIITDIENLLGKSPRRPIRPGRPVRARDVQRPVTVEKGGLVTMTLSTPTMVITAIGRVADAGGDGEFVRVRNTRSQIVVQGIITGPTEVRVLPNHRLATAAD